jgi:CheY-specific phosphatase CheX
VVESKDLVVNAFTEAIGLALREMAGIEVAPRGISTQAFTRPLEVCAYLKLKSVGEGDLAIVLSKQVAYELASRIFAQSGMEIDEAMLPDCIGEVANVVAGQAKTLLFGTPAHFVLSTPTLMPESLPHPNDERTIITIASEIGEMILCLRFPSLM